MKTCPFCGGTPRVEVLEVWAPEYMITCDSCGACTGSFKSPLEAEAAWEVRWAPHWPRELDDPDGPFAKKNEEHDRG